MNNVVYDMTAAELRKQLDVGASLYLIDVREDAEFAGGSIPGAVHIPVGSVFAALSNGSLPTDKKIITICRSGARAELVARELRNRGYDIESLEGGLIAWIRSEHA